MEERQPVKTDSWQKVYEGVEQLRAAVLALKGTGTHYIKVDTNQGGVVQVRIATETKV